MTCARTHRVVTTAAAGRHMARSALGNHQDRFHGDAQRQETVDTSSWTVLTLLAVVVRVRRNWSSSEGRQLH
eukprot:2489905-Alexandrium_andersonii.AAC.1